MTAYKTTPQSVVMDIQRLLSESYGSGFTIFKELVQNADDVRASRLLLAIISSTLRMLRVKQKYSQTAWRITSPGTR